MRGTFRLTWCAFMPPFTFAVFASVVAAAGCAPTLGSPLWFARDADPRSGVSVVIPDIGPCQGGPALGMTIDPARPLVVLVHGCNSSAGRFTTLARVFKAQGQQAVCFSYDDRKRLEDSAGRLIAALEALKSHLDARQITVLGHSQGGLVARRALVGGRAHGLREGDGFRYQLVTVSSPFHGIEASADCGSTFLHVATLGVTVGVCRMVAGAMWREIHPRSAFMRHPGTLLGSVERHVKIVTDERGSCRHSDAAGRCVKSDFVFSLSEQYAPVVDDDTRAQSAQVKAGHVDIVGETGNAPQKLIHLLQAQQILAAPGADRRTAFAALVDRLYW